MKKKFGIVGCGFLGGIVADAWAKGLLPGYQLVGVTSRTFAHAQALAEKVGCPAFETLEELLAQKPELVVEAAGGPALKQLALPVLNSGASLAVISIGAFADAAFLEQAEQAARQNDAKIYLASGAIGGFDVLNTVRLMAQAQGKPLTAGISTRKGPASLKGTPIFADKLLTDTQPTQVFAGDAAQAIADFPTKVNVAVATALATSGPQQTQVRITSVPGFVGDEHTITAEAAGVKACVQITSDTSAIAGWSLVALLRNLDAPIQFQ